MTRPSCATCGSDIPPALLSNRDWQSELESCGYIDGVKMPGAIKPRPYYCSMSCMGIAREGLHARQTPAISSRSDDERTLEGITKESAA